MPVARGAVRAHPSERRIPAAAATLLIVIAFAASSCTSDPAAAQRQTPRNAQEQTGYQRVIQELLPSLVEISTKSSSGSGVVFDTHGDIVTNDRVVDGATTVTVRATDLSEPVRARLVGTFAPDDLAVIRVNHDANQLRPARFASPSAAQVGAIVLAMGSPYGLADNVTQGIISATGRVISGHAAKGSPPPVIVNAIQTSAPINQGNSGGALALLSGQVIGIPTVSATDPRVSVSEPGVGFAISSGTVVSIAAQLIKNGKVTRPDRAWLGISGQTIDTFTGVPLGVTVDSVSTRGPAARAGIRHGDVIVGLDGRRTPTLSDLELLLAACRPGRKTTVEILRNGNPRQVTAILGTMRS